jgi:hypothetical protein
VIPYIGPEVVAVLKAGLSSPEPVSPALAKRSDAHPNRKEPIPFRPMVSSLGHFPHMLSGQRHSNAWVAMIGLVTRWLL